MSGHILNLRCPNYRHGCMLAFDDTIEQVNHINVCCFRSIQCLYCTDYFPLLYLKEHIEVECVNKDFFCANCFNKCSRANLPEHKSKCLMNIINCPKCLATIMKQDLPFHNQICRYRPDDFFVLKDATFCGVEPTPLNSTMNDKFEESASLLQTLDSGVNIFDSCKDSILLEAEKEPYYCRQVLAVKNYNSLAHKVTFQNCYDNFTAHTIIYPNGIGLGYGNYVSVKVVIDKSPGCKFNWTPDLCAVMGILDSSKKSKEIIYSKFLKKETLGAFRMIFTKECFVSKMDLALSFTSQNSNDAQFFVLFGRKKILTCSI